jgi:hypothetical protein
MIEPALLLTGLCVLLIYSRRPPQNLTAGGGPCITEFMPEASYRQRPAHWEPAAKRRRAIDFNADLNLRVMGIVMTIYGQPSVLDTEINPTGKVM